MSVSALDKTCHFEYHVEEVKDGGVFVGTLNTGFSDNLPNFEVTLSNVKVMNREEAVNGNQKKHIKEVMETLRDVTVGMTVVIRVIDKAHRTVEMYVPAYNDLDVSEYLRMKELV